MKRSPIHLAICASTAVMASQASADFGQSTQQQASSQASRLFGVEGPLEQSSSASLTAAEANSNPAGLASVARGLRVSVVSASADLSPNIDQMILWPNDKNPTHLIACNEQGSGQVAVQRIALNNGAPANIISSGLTSCDPIRATPWGTVLVAEENGTNGRLFEIIDPLNTNGVIVTGSGAATTISDPAHVARRGAVGQFSFEGLALFPNGVLYMSDENRPGAGNPGGAIVKFIPQTLWTGSAPITALAQSPLAAGTLWGMRLGRNSGNTDFGQGNEFGRGVWVELPASSDATPTNLRSAALSAKLTSYYRPEDMAVDLEAQAAGLVRFCGTNTGQDIPGSDNHFGEVYCITDDTIAAAAGIARTTQTVGGTSFSINTASVPEYQPLIIGNLQLAMMDNIAYQPGSGNFVVHEDGEGPLYATPRNNDLWDCLDDGDDDDNLSDACVRIASLNDLSAEWTGGLFDASGKNFYVSVQHNVTGHGVILKLTGFRDAEEKGHHGWKKQRDHHDEHDSHGEQD